MPETFLAYDSFGHQKRTPMRFEADVFECEVEGEIPPELEDAARRGAEACPEQAITIIDAPPPVSVAVSRAAAS